MPTAALYDQGLKLSAEGRHLEAIGCFEAALGYAPNDAKILFALGNTAQTLGMPGPAELFFRRVLAAEPGRIVRFVRAARSLIWLQLGLAAVALAVTAWGVFAVRGLVVERDRLLNRIGALETAVNQAEANAANAAIPLPPPLPPEPDYNLMTPTTPPADVNLTVPPPTTEAPITNEVLPGRDIPGREARPEDCTGRFATLPRCRREPLYSPPDDLTPRGPPLGRDGVPERARPDGERGSQPPRNP